MKTVICVLLLLTMTTGYAGFDQETLEKQGYLVLNQENTNCHEEDLKALKDLFPKISNGGFRGNGKSATFITHICCELGAFGNNLSTGIDDTNGIPTCLSDFFKNTVQKLPGIKGHQYFLVEFTLNDAARDKLTNFQVAWHRDSAITPIQYLFLLNLENNFPKHDFTLGKVKPEFRGQITDKPIQTNKGQSSEMIPDDWIDTIEILPVEPLRGYLIDETVKPEGEHSGVYHATSVAKFPVTNEGNTGSYTRKTIILRITPVISPLYPAVLQEHNLLVFSNLKVKDHLQDYRHLEIAHSIRKEKIHEPVATVSKHDLVEERPLLNSEGEKPAPVYQNKRLSPNSEGEKPAPVYQSEGLPPDFIIFAVALKTLENQESVAYWYKHFTGEDLQIDKMTLIAGHYILSFATAFSFPAHISLTKRGTNAFIYSSSFAISQIISPQTLGTLFYYPLAFALLTKRITHVPPQQSYPTTFDIAMILGNIAASWHLPEYEDIMKRSFESVALLHIGHALILDGSDVFLEKSPKFRMLAGVKVFSHALYLSAHLPQFYRQWIQQ